MPASINSLNLTLPFTGRSVIYFNFRVFIFDIKIPE